MHETNHILNQRSQHAFPWQHIMFSEWRPRRRRCQNLAASHAAHALRGPIDLAAGPGRIDLFLRKPGLVLATVATGMASLGRPMVNQRTLPMRMADIIYGGSICISFFFRASSLHACMPVYVWTNVVLWTPAAVSTSHHGTDGL